MVLLVEIMLLPYLVILSSFNYKFAGNTRNKQKPQLNQYAVKRRAIKVFKSKGFLKAL